MTIEEDIDKILNVKVISCKKLGYLVKNENYVNYEHIVKLTNYVNNELTKHDTPVSHKKIQSYISSYVQIIINYTKCNEILEDSFPIDSKLFGMITDLLVKMNVKVSAISLITRMLENKKLVTKENLFKVIHSLYTSNYTIDQSYLGKIISHSKTLKFTIEDVYDIFVENNFFNDVLYYFNIIPMYSTYLDDDNIFGLFDKYTSTCSEISSKTLYRIFFTFVSIYNDTVNLLKGFLKYLECMNKVTNFDYIFYAELHFYRNIPFTLDIIKDILRLDKRLRINNQVVEIIAYKNITIDQECIDIAVTYGHYELLSNTRFIGPNKLSCEQMLSVLKNIDDCHIKYRIFNEYLTKKGLLTSELFMECCRCNKHINNQEQEQDTLYYNSELYKIAIQPNCYDCTHCIMLFIDKKYVITQQDLYKLLSSRNTIYLYEKMDEIRKYLTTVNGLILTNDMIDVALSNDNIEMACLLIDCNVTPTETQLDYIVNGKYSLSKSNVDTLLSHGATMSYSLFNRFCVHDIKYKHLSNDLIKVIEEHDMVISDIIIDYLSYHLKSDYQFTKFLLERGVKFNGKQLKNIYNTASKNVFKIVLGSIPDDIIY